MYIVSPQCFIQRVGYPGSVLPRVKGKAYLEGVVWVEHATTSKLLALPNSHIKEKSIPKTYWANIPYICWGEHYLRFPMSSFAWLYRITSPSPLASDLASTCVLLVFCLCWNWWFCIKKLLSIFCWLIELNWSYLHCKHICLCSEQHAWPLLILNALPKQLFPLLCRLCFTVGVKHGLARQKEC